MLSQALSHFQAPSGSGQASVPHSDPLSHLSIWCPQNFHQAFCPDDSQLQVPPSPCPLRVFLATSNCAPHILTPDHQRSPCPLNSHLFSGGHKTPSLPVLNPTELSHPVPPTRECSSLDSSCGSSLPPFRAQPKCHLLREASLLCVTTPHSHVTQVYYLQEHLFVYFAYCLFLPL